MNKILTLVTGLIILWCRTVIADASLNTVSGTTTLGAAPASSTTNNGTLTANVLIGNGARGVVNGSASGAVPANADGSATTLAQIGSLGQGPVLTNNNVNSFVIFTNNGVSLSLNSSGIFTLTNYAAAGLGFVWSTNGSGTNTGNIQSATLNTTGIAALNGNLSISNSASSVTLSNNTHYFRMQTSDGFGLDFIQDGSTRGTLNNSGNWNVGSISISGSTAINSSRDYSGRAGAFSTTVTATNGFIGGDAGQFTVDSKGWQQWPGESTLTSDQTSTSATLASTTLSVTLVAGKTYTFQAELFLSDSTAADGAKIDFNGGTATATTFRAQITAFDTALNLSSQVTALNTASSASTFTGAGAFEVHGTIFVNAGGTFIPQFAQANHSIGTLTLAKGSFIRFHQTP